MSGKAIHGFSVVCMAGSRRRSFPGPCRWPDWWRAGGLAQLTRGGDHRGGRCAGGAGHVYAGVGYPALVSAAITGLWPLDSSAGGGAGGWR